MHILSSDQFTKPEIEELFKRAKYIRDNPGRYTRELGSKVMATLFFEPSTRTELSFQTAMYRLGGNVISPREDSSIKKGESYDNMVKTISQYADVVVVRHPYSYMIKQLSNSCDVPLINAGNGALDHPTQGLLDLFTIFELATNHPTKILFTGDLLRSRTIPSLLTFINHYYEDFQLCFSGEINLNIIPENLNYSVITEAEIPSVLPNVDIIYMTRNQVERIGLSAPQYKFKMTTELANSMGENAAIMHPLPCNDELPLEINSHPRAKYFEQVKNGLWIRMAILWTMLRGN